MTHSRPDPPPVPWKDVDRIFAAAMDRPADEREAFVEAACAGEPARIAAVRRLLDAVPASKGRFEAPASEVLEGALAAIDRVVDPGPVGPYAIVRQLGRGGMGSVYLAERLQDGVRQRVALKVLRHGLDTADIVGRFLRERRILGSLTHPGIARFIDGGATVDGRPYLAMEFVDGVPITEWCDRERATLQQRLTLFLEVADAVRAAHASLVIHRDLKPSNILVSSGRVKLLDFGIAKILADGADGADHTRTGLLLLTPEIASPEQLAGGPVTTATDVYQLGVLLCQLLTGSRHTGAPSDGTSRLSPTTSRRPSALIAPDRRGVEAAQRRATSVAHLRRTLRGDLDTIVLKATHEEPQRRYASVDQLADDVRRHLDRRVISARPDTWTYRARTYARRQPWVVPVAAAMSLGVLAYIGTLTWYTARLAQESAAARLEAERALAVQTFLVDLFRSPDPYDPLDPERLREITVVEALDIGAERLRAELVDRPAIREALLLALAEVYENLNAHDRALPLRKEVLALQEARAPGSLDVVESLGRLSASVGKLQGEEPLHALLDRWLTAAEALDPAQPAVVAEARVGIAVHAMATYELETAERHLREVIALAENAPIPARIQADAYRTLANLHQALDRLDLARAAAERALALRIEVDSDDSVETALARVALAQVLVEQGHLDEGDATYALALETLDRRLGPDHRLTLVSLNSLALLRREQQDHEGAAALLRRLVHSHRRVHGQHDKLVGDTLQNLATVLRESGQADEARRLHEEAAEVYRRAIGADSYHYALPRLSLASLDLAEGRPRDAERNAREALDILRRVLPGGHVVTAVAGCRVARALAGQGRMADARPLFEASAATLVPATVLSPYRHECLTAAAAFFARSGELERVATINRALGGG
jgi:eukaryotic-like serine/threonine-protein kinase